jgi:hypothetical protein
MAKIENFVDALEAYLAKQGKGGSYLADKLTGLFEDKTSPLNLNDGPLKDFGDKLKDFNNNLNDLNKFTQKLNKKIMGMNIPSFSAVKFPNLTGFKKTLDSLLNRMRDFRDSIKIEVLNTFMENIKSMNVLTGKINGILENSNNTKSTRDKNAGVDVNIVGIDSAIKSFLSNVLKKAGTVNNIVNQKDKDKEEGSIVGKIIKGIIGTVALLAGIGFLSKFLDTPMGKAVGNALGNMKNAFIEMLKPFLEKLFDYSMEGLRVFFYDLPKYFLKQTFNFFGLKEKLGEENEGLAVILTKGIYYGLKKVYIGIANKFTLGGFSKGLSKIFGPLFSTADSIGKLEKLGDKIYRLGGNVSAIPKYLTRLTSGLSKSSFLFKSIFSVIDKTFSTLLYVPKIIWKFFSNMGFGVGKITQGIGAIAKIGGGSILKILGAGLKRIAKGIPFIGGLISFKDAYDRFKKGDITGGLISIGSGIASFFPGIGTAISIGLDVLNAFLDNKTEGGKTSKLAAIGDMLKSLWDGFVDGVKGFFGIIGDILSLLNPVVAWGKKIWKWVTGETEKIEKSFEGENKSTEYNTPKQDGTKTQRPRRNPIRSNIPTKNVGDARLTNNNLIVPSSDDDIIMAKTGGPFDQAFKEMNEKLDALITVFAQGTQLIANTTIQGSASVAQAVASNSGKSPIIIGGNDPIADFRLRANKSVG